MNGSSHFSPESELSDEVLSETLSLGLEIANEVIDFQAHRVSLFPADQASLAVKTWLYLKGFQVRDAEIAAISEEDLFEAYRRGFYFFGHFQKHRTAYREADYRKVIEERPDWAKHTWRRISDRSLLVLPLFRNDFLFGIIIVGHRERNHFLARDESLGTCLSRLLSQALFDAGVRARLRRLKVTMLDRRIALFGDLNLRQIGSHYAEMALWLLHPEVPEPQPCENHKKIARSSVRLVDESRKELYYIGTYESEQGGEWPEDKLRIRHSLDGPSKPALALQRHEPIIVPDAGAEPEYLWLFKDTKSMLVAPICGPRQEEPMGVLSVSVTAGMYMQDDADLLWLLASHVSGPVGAALTRERLERRNEQLHLLANMSRTMQATGSLLGYAKARRQQPFRETAHVLAGSLFKMGYGRVLISKVDWANKLVLGVFSKGDLWMEELQKRTTRQFDRDAGDIQVLVVKSGKAVTISDPQSDMRAHTQDAPECEVRPFAVLPLLVREEERVIGTIHIERRDRQPISEREIRDDLMPLADHAAVALLSSRERSLREAIFQQMGEPAYVVDLNYNLIAANALLCDLLGTSQEGLVGQKCYKVIHRFDNPCDECGEECVIHQLEQSGGHVATISRELEVRPSKRQVWLQKSAASVSDEQGVQIGFVVTARDVTNSRILLTASQNMQAAVDATEICGIVMRALIDLGYAQIRRYEAQEDSNKLALIQYYPDRPKINEAEVAFNQRDHAEAFKVFELAFPIVCRYDPGSPPDAPVLREGEMRVTQSGDLYREELHKDGVYEWLDLPLMAGRDVLGKISLNKGSSSLFAKSDLKDPASLIIKLRDGRDPLSRYLREQFSSDTRRLLDKYDGSRLPSEALQKALVAKLNKLLKSSCLFDRQRFAQVKLTKETLRWIERNPKGKDLIHLNRLLLEQAYPEIGTVDKFSQEEYETLTVLSRLAAQALERAYHFNRSEWLQLMWGSVLHYFVTPAHNIQFAWDLLRGELSDAKKAQVEMDMTREIALLRARVNAAVDAEALLAKRGGFARETVNLQDLAVAAVDYYRDLGYQVPVVKEFRRTPLKVTVDKVMVPEVLGGVIENAALHASPTEIVVAVKQRGGKAVVEIRDDGCGIPKEKQHLLFQPYTRLYEHSRRRGTGLGLFLAKQVAEAERGDLTVQSKDRGPTTFQFTFPLAERRKTQ